MLNDGQADLEGIEITLEGIPENYYSVSSDRIDLISGERKTMSINFSIPIYADIGVTSVTLKVGNSDFEEEKVFGLNILNKSSAEASPTTGLATGFSIPLISYNDLIFVAIFAAACFSVAIILKKVKVSGEKTENDNSFLSDVENYIKKDDLRAKVNESGSYDKLIITEFPNVMKFSKELKQTKNKG